MTGSEVQRVLERVAAEWTLTFDAIEFPILLIGAAGEILRLNLAAKELAGKDYSELAGKPLGCAGSGEPWNTIALLVAASRTGAEHRRTNGQRARHVENRATGAAWDVAVHAVGQGDGRLIAVAQDISTTVRLQKSLRRSEHLSAIGELVAGVAHQVRNPIFSISATLEAMDARFHGRVEGCETYMSVLRRELGRLRELMEDLLEFGKPVLCFEPTGLEDVVADAISACRPLAADRGVELTTSVAAGPRPLSVDRARLAQALQNVVENAIQHSDPDTTVAVTAGEIDGGEWIECEIRDHGKGFDSKALTSAFEPFYTSRSGGTGLGLSIVQRIVEQHGGEVVLANAADGGGRVTIRVPARGDRHEPLAAAGGASR